MSVGTAEQLREEGTRPLATSLNQGCHACHNICIEAGIWYRYTMCIHLLGPHCKGGGGCVGECHYFALQEADAAQGVVGDARGLEGTTALPIPVYGSLCEQGGAAAFKDTTAPRLVLFLQYAAHRPAATAAAQQSLARSRFFCRRSRHGSKRETVTRQLMAQADGATSRTVECHDFYLGRRLRLPLDQRAQVDAPLHVIAAAAVRLHLPRNHPLALEQPPPPSGYTSVSLWPAQLQRAAIGFAAAASHGLATAPASVDVSARTTWHWRMRILRRVMGGCVGRIQVRARLRAAVVTVAAARYARCSPLCFTLTGLFVCCGG